MNQVFELILVRVARKAGGDRYECMIEGEDKPLVLYFPQSISRADGSVKETITMTLGD